MGQTSLVYRGIKFDSDEEVFMAMWLQELQQGGFVSSWDKTQTPIVLTEGCVFEYTVITQLKTKIKNETKKQVLLRPSEYTPDFRVDFTEKGEELFVGYLNALLSKHSTFRSNMLFYSNTKKVILEVKPMFDQQNMERLFKNNQKFIWDKHRIFVNLVEPIALFKKTFMPTEAAPYFKYIKSPTGKNKGKKGPGDWKMDWEPKTLKQYLHENNNS